MKTWPPATDAVTAALALADRPTGAVDLLLGTADEAEWWARMLRDRIEWAEGHDPFADSGAMVDGLAVPRAVVGDVGGNGSASGWELSDVSTLWQPWRSFGQHARQAAAQRDLEWPDHRPELTTVLAPVGSLLAEVSGVADAKRCLQGSFSACGWFMAGTSSVGPPRPFGTPRPLRRRSSRSRNGSDSGAILH